MNNVSNKKAITDFLRAKPQVKAPKPKFEVGDYIINSKFKVISKIIEIIGIFDNEDMTANYEVAQYVMRDIKNDARDKFMSGIDTANGSGNAAYNHTVQRNYKRQKYVRGIDATYHKITPEVVQTLYGIKLNYGDENVSN